MKECHCRNRKWDLFQISNADKSKQSTHTKCTISESNRAKHAISHSSYAWTRLNKNGTEKKIRAQRLRVSFLDESFEWYMLVHTLLGLNWYTVRLPNAYCVLFRYIAVLCRDKLFRTRFFFCVDTTSTSLRMECTMQENAAGHLSFVFFFPKCTTNVRGSTPTDHSFSNWKIRKILMLRRAFHMTINRVEGHAVARNE